MTCLPPRKSALLFLAMSLAACGGQDNPTEDTTSTPTATSPEAAVGETFESALAGGSSGGEGPVASPGIPEDDGEGNEGGEERSVEEADIVTQVDNTLFVLNTYRGLQALDVSDPDSPDLMGRLPLTGYPVEMYVRDGRAYIIVSDYYSYWPMLEVGDAAVSTGSFRGSVLAIVDVSDPTSMTLLGQINLEGFVGQTRAVGDVIYAISNHYAWYSCDGSSEDSEDSTVVISVDISDPQNPVQVDQLRWPGTTAQIHATSDTLFVAEPIYRYDDEGNEEDDEGEESGGDTDESGGEVPASSGGGSTKAPAPPPDEDATPNEDGSTPEEPNDDPIEPSYSPYFTGITLVDISDPHGVIIEQGSIEVPGTTWDKFALDAFDGTFRIVTQKYDGVSSATLTILNIEDPDVPSQLSTMDIILPIQEWVTAARFDEDRAYIVTAEKNDPLFIVDLGDPSSPRLAGQVEMPGQLNHLELNGDRIIAFGQDNEVDGTWLFAVSLFDVADIDAPLMLDRETIGDGDYSSSLATWDDKSFTLLRDQGLMALPFAAYEEDTWRYINGVQLVDFDDESLTLKGSITHPGYIRRVRDVGDRLYSISDTDLVVIDATNRDDPTITAERELSQYIADYMPLGDIGARLITSNYYSYYDPYDSGEGARLEIVPSDAPDGMDTLASVTLEAYDGLLVSINDTTLGVIKSEYDEDYNTLSTLDIYDLSTPSAPQLLSSTALPGPVYSYANASGASYGSSGGALVKNGDSLAWLETVYTYYGYPEESSPDSGEEPEDTHDGGGSDAQTPSPSKGKADTYEEGDILSFLHVLDLSDLGAPTTETFEFETSLFGLIANEGLYYATFAEQTSEEWPATASYYVQRIDPISGAMGEPVNVPGTTIQVREGGTELLTVDVQWKVSPEGYDYVETSLNLVGTSWSGAWRIDESTLPGYVYSIRANEGAIYSLSQPFWWDVETSDDYYGCYYSGVLSLMSHSLNNQVIEEESAQELPISYGYMRELTAEHLFVDGYTGGLLIYDLADTHAPVYQEFVRTSGWALHVRVRDSAAYLPAGMYGVSQTNL